ncbi:MAG: 2-oxo acid dehydrogenase subunit E2 [Cyanobacteria bacterium P01_C01_bin.69]
MLMPEAQKTIANGVREIDWPVHRNNITDFLANAKRKAQISGTWEIDITLAQARIKEIQRRTRIAISFNAYLIFLIGRAVHQHPEVQAVRLPWRRKLAFFDEVDVGTAVEQRMPDGALIPLPYIVRNAESKSLAEICYEMRQACKRDLISSDPDMRRWAQLAYFPTWLRRLIWNWVDLNPVRRRRVRGTFWLTNVLTNGRTPGFGHFLAVMSSSLGIGSAYDRLVPSAQDPRGFVVRKHLCCTLGVDHVVIDGAPMVRFARTFADLLEKAEGLDEQFVEDLVVQYQKP